MTDVEQSLMETVPNFAEGRDEDVIRSLKEPFLGHDQVQYFDLHVDEDHDRSVITAVGTPSALLDVLVEAISVAVDQIDITDYTGTHPCLGAADVVPLVPLGKTSMDQAVQTVKELASTITSFLELPVYLYGEAATVPWRENLANIRKPNRRTLQEKIRSDPDWDPDFGPMELHKQAGLCCMGARDFLIALNVDIREGTIEDCRQMARDIRASSGGLPAVQAMGMKLERQDRLIVSVNLLNYHETSPYELLDELRQRARHYGVQLGSTELVGLLPEEAVSQGDFSRLNIPNFDPDRHILERRINMDLLQEKP